MPRGKKGKRKEKVTTKLDRAIIGSNSMYAWTYVSVIYIGFAGFKQKKNIQMNMTVKGQEAADHTLRV